MDMVHAVFARSLARMESVGDTDVEIAVGSLVYDSRNKLCAKALEDGYDRILWLDSDMVFEPDLMRRLSADLDEGREMVCGLYFRRTLPTGPVIFKNCGIYQMQPGELSPMAVPYNDYPKDRVFEIEACGFGAVMMDAAALRRTAEKLGPWPFMPVGGLGEDLSFCMRWNDAGGKIWCDSAVRLGHAGGRIYGEEDFET
jgi:GT2 family glycosyltransferase